MTRPRKPRPGQLEAPRRELPNAERLTKREVACRELNAAIRMFFFDGDAVAIHVLVSAAHDILRPIATARALKTLRDQFMERVPRHFQDDARECLSSSYNYMKHAGRDADEQLTTFDPAINRPLLIDGARTYVQLFQEPSFEIALLLRWMVLCEPEYLKPEARSEFISMVEPLLGFSSDPSEAARLAISAFDAERRSARPKMYKPAV